MTKAEQSQMQVLKSRVAELERQLAAFELPGSPVVRSSLGSEYGIPNQTIRFYVDQERGEFIDVRLDGKAVQVRGLRPLVIVADVSNSFWVRSADQ